MLKTTKLTLPLSICMWLLLSCNISSSPIPTPVEIEATSIALAATTDPLPFEGMWVTEGDAPAVIVFTKDSMYWVQSDQVSADDIGTRERFAKIVSYDLANNHIVLFTQWIRVNGQMFGFDAPNFNITYQIDGDSLRVGIGWDEEFVTETDAVVYFRK